MTITLNKQNIQNDINARYMMTMQDADTMPPAGERDQAISEAFSSLVALLSPMVSGSTPASLSIELHSTARIRLRILPIRSSSVPLSPESTTT